jgi:hypothetical protein
VLAYVFWHRPRAGVEAGDYATALRAFHERVGVPSWFAALARPPWGEDAGWFEDWYLVEDWNGLGRLSEHAVSGPRRPPHDHVAGMAGEGIAGIYARLAGRPEPPAWIGWVAKPEGEAYADFVPALCAAAGAEASVWQRQMTLGPTPEFVALGPAPLGLPWPVVATGPATAAP